MPSPDDSEPAPAADRGRPGLRLGVDPCLVGDPVHLPGLATVRRERLLEVGGARREGRPVETDQDALLIQRILSVELPMAVLECTDLRDGNHTVLTVGPIESPLAGLGIIETQRKSLDT